MIMENNGDMPQWHESSKAEVSMKQDPESDIRKQEVLRPTYRTLWFMECGK